MLEILEVEAVLAGGVELRGFEVKGAGPRTESHLFAKVTRAALGMGNRRDGGHVVIGISDGDLTAMLPGLDGDDLASWLSYDDVARKLAEYADPPLRFAIAALELSSGATVAVVEVVEFEDIPHLCKKSHEPVLRQGALYVRPRKVPETSEVASSVEMREVIDLATEKGIRDYVGIAERAGLAITSRPTTASDSVRYQAEREEAW
jgi:hypothetical protein